jgi:hypothetical protein
MATFTDTLNTVFRITGGAQMAAEMQAIALGAADLATGLEAATVGAAGLMAALGPISIILLAIAAAVEVLTAGWNLLTSSLKAFSEESKKLFETGVVLKNLGSSITSAQIKQFANATSIATGIQRPEIESGAGILASAGVKGGNIERTLRVTADFARGRGVDFEKMAEIVAKGVEGVDKGLKQFGITLQDTGSRAANLELVLQQLALRTRGAAEAYRQTLPGSMEAASASLQRFLSALGEQFAPAAIRVFNAISFILDKLTENIDGLANSLALLLGGPLGLAFKLGTQAADAGKDPMAKVGQAGFGPQDAEHLAEIADNTKMMADSVVQSVLGGQGEIVQQAFGFMTARMALAI